MIEIEIKGNLSEIAGIRLTNEDKDTIIQQLGKEITKEIKKRCPVVTGELKKSIKQKNIKGGFKIFSNKEYAYWVEYGSGIYQVDEDGSSTGHTGWDVYPVKAKYLRWKDKDGKIHFSKHVYIRGQEGQFFFKEGRLAGLRKLGNIATKYLKEVKNMK